MVWQILQVLRHIRRSQRTSTVWALVLIFVSTFEFCRILPQMFSLFFKVVLQRGLHVQLLYVSIFMVNFLLRKIFRGNLNEAFSLVEIASCRFWRKVLLKRKSRLMCTALLEVYMLEKTWLFLQILVMDLKIECFYNNQFIL